MRLDASENDVLESVKRDAGHRHRERSAFVAAPFIAACVWYVVALLHLVGVNGRLRWGPDILAMAIGAVTWGLAVAWFVTLLLAVPLYWVVQRTLGVSFATAALGGTGVGLVLSAVFWLVNGEWGVLFSPVHGILVGLVTAVLWWYLAGRLGAVHVLQLKPCLGGRRSRRRGIDRQSCDHVWAQTAGTLTPTPMCAYWAHIMLR